MGRNYISSLESRTLVIGAGVTGEMTVQRMLSGDADMPGIPVVIVDDDPSKHGTQIEGVPVAGGRLDIPRLCGEYAIDQVVFSIPSASREVRTAIYDICLTADVRILTLPHILGTPIPQVGRTPLLRVKPEDLLARDEVKLDLSLVSGYLTGKTVLVTGGGGSIGSEICRQLIPAKPSRIVMFDIYENTTYELLCELAHDWSDSGIEFVVEIGSIRDCQRLEALFAEYSPAVVFHAAAHKHVPLMERNPREAVLNNVIGTLNVARLADKAGVERFVMISTDKAVNPTSVMGASKRVCELIVQDLASRSSTVFTSVRFGNVLGSHGSVIPLFEHQIEQGGPVTVTHKDITRYFMTIPEASRLVIEAGALAQGGETFVLDMGEPVRIYDLADKMIRLSGHTPGVDMDIQITGLRPGEKLFEELMTGDEELIPTGYPSIRISRGDPVDPKALQQHVAALGQAALGGSDDDVVDALSVAVPNFHREAGAGGGVPLSP